MSFWDIIWFIIVTFAFVAYLMVMFTIIADLFRDRELSGWWKAVWIIFLIFVPFLTALIYLIARSKGMAQRQAQSVADAVEAQQAYIKQVASEGSSPADQIASAKKLLDDGAITAEEFDALKAKALS
ncbi:SHOCT domain-containing protein [Nocardioides insulae]|uniref:SHOCT domain-containing protein n=1 Tax=Nocardioides insulae TaxID=394734 RepID=UPI0004202791|nr:SHOCT domain-containing protein [Nocardioides insulae]